MGKGKIVLSNNLVTPHWADTVYSVLQQSDSFLYIFESKAQVLVTVAVQAIAS